MHSGKTVAQELSAKCSVFIVWLELQCYNQYVGQHPDYSPASHSTSVKVSCD